MINFSVLTSMKLSYACSLQYFLGGLNKFFGPERGLIGEGGLIDRELEREFMVNKQGCPNVLQ